MFDEVDEQRMTLALKAAADAAESGEVPVGAVVFHRNRLIGRAYNQREMLQDPTAHAEILAITQAAAALGSWRLDDCTMYVTLEPCAMCAGALVLARMSRLVFGAHDPKAGACGSVLDVLACERLNHTVDVVSGVLAEPCGLILSEFFQQRRRDKRDMTDFDRLDISVVNRADRDFEHVAAVRRRVFIEEQAIPERLEWDATDEAAVHLLATLEGHEVGTLRFFNDDGWMRVGRVAVLPEHRGSGVGRRLMEKCLEEGRRRGYARSVVNAQADKTGFYRRLGYREAGDVFMEDGIPHVRMELVF